MLSLKVNRAGTVHGNEPTARYSVTIPPLTLDGAELPFGNSPVRAGTRFSEVDASSIVEPSRWERRYIDWLSEQCCCSVRWSDQDEVEHSVTDALRSTAGWRPDQIPNGVRIRRASTRRGEARAVASDIRAWLSDRGLTGVDAARACDDILVLIPGRSELFGLWTRELEQADLPVCTNHAEPVALHSCARWIVALTQLRNWDAEPVSRELLRSILEARFWSQRAALAAVGEESDLSLRKTMRALLTQIRRDSFRFGDWESHVASSADEGGDAVLAVSRRLRDALAEGRDYFSRLNGLMRALNVRGTLAVLSDPYAISVGDRVLGALSDLAYEEAKHGGRHPDADTNRLDQIVEQALRRTWIKRGTERRHGVRVVAYESYDGARSDLLFATGLGEGDYPIVASRWSLAEEAAARQLGILGTDESFDGWAHDELERQIRLVTRAFDSCSGPVTLSFTTEGPGTEERYPGPLLSLLVGGWREADWYHPTESVEVFTWADEIPRAPEHALGWSDVALFAEDARFRRWLRDVDLDVLDHADYERLRWVRDVADGLASSLLAFRERHPRADESIRFDAYSGMLPGKVEPPPAYSASALEAYGQCGTKYFLGKVLGISDDDDLSESLEATETGTIIHNAFADAAHEAIDRANGVLWSMCIHPGTTREENVERVLADVHRHLELTVRKFLTEQSSMSEELVAAVVARWSGAFRLWIDSHLVDRLPGQPSDEELEQNKEVASARKLLRDYDDALELARGLKRAVESGEVTSKSAAGSYGSTAGNKTITKANLTDAYESGDFDSLIDRLETDREACLLAVQQAEAVAREECARHFNRDVVHAELSFGLDERSDADPDSIAEPVTVYVDELAIPVRGQVDRIDWDTDRGQIAIRDFKTGRRKSAAELGRQIAVGRHLQLPLYAMAVEELARLGHLPHLTGTRAVEISLEHPRDPVTHRRWATQLRLDADSGYTVGEHPTTWSELARGWLGSHVRNIQAGHFPLLPTGCPVENTDYCDFDRCCGYTPEFGRRASDPRSRRPDVVHIIADDAKLKFPCPDVRTPICRVSAPEETSAQREHDRASEAASDVTRDVAIAAGAGTGKTYNLVLRYLAALVDGALPSEILCITFTRRAASEMKNRIREALLSNPEGPQRPLVEELRRDPTAFRRLLLSLSAAPITTIDALAGSVFREAEAFRAQRRGSTAPQMEVVTDADVADQLQTFVRQRFLDSIEARDEHLSYLAERLDPIAVRDLLLEACKRDITDELAELPTLEARKRYLIDAWYRIMQPAADELLAILRTWPVDDFDAKLQAALAESAKSRQPSDDGVAWIERLRATLARTDAIAPAECWEFLREALTGKVNQSRFGKAGLSDAYREAVNAVKARYENGDPERWKACTEWMKALESLDEYATTAAHATFVAQVWAHGFRDHLVANGRVRFSDVEALARLAIEEPDLAQALGSRFPYRHIFVDEAQDTSYSQIRLIEAVREVATRATGAACRQFVVGDVKQSIYAFRGAEVDVFTRRIADGAERFTINRRSTPTLLRAFNTLFDALFVGESADGEALDPRAEVPFETLGWSAERHDPEEPAIELFAVAGESWFPTATEDEEPTFGAEEEEEEEDEPEDTLRATPLQRSLATRVAELIEQYPPGDRGASVALLVGSWRRADFYRDLLDAYGISAAVQGGRGLLNSAEVDNLVQWLEAVAYPNRHIAFTAALRGPGIAVSDAGLYCLRQGFGAEIGGAASRRSSATRLNRIKTAAVYGTFNAQDAVTTWYQHDPELDTNRAIFVLRRDEAALSRFREVWSELNSRLGVEAPSETIAWLADTLGLWTFWHAREGGRQAIANLRTFLDLVRDLEASLGQDPWVILRRLREMRDNSDPAAGGLEASGGAPVVITTYWQAKGREWPVVVLPDIEKTRTRTSPRGLGDNRICVVDADMAVVHTPEIRESKPEKPMSSSVTAVTHVLDQYRRPAQRAELRRLLYVAMTRAKEKLVISGTFEVPTTDDPDKPTSTTLHAAKDWATTLRVCLDLQLGEDGALHVGRDTPWGSLARDGRVVVIEGNAYGEDRRPPTQTRPPTPLPEHSTARHWLAVTSPRLELLRPSDLVVSELPPHDTELSTALPVAQVVRENVFATDADEGTAFHAIMESLAFGDGDKEAAIHHALETQRLDYPADSLDARVAALHTLVDGAYSAPIVEELRAAASRGELYHELPLRFVRDDDRLVYGVIDLVWRDAAGRYHILDYKTGFRHPTVDDIGIQQTRHHFAQTRCYAEGLELCGFDVASFGIWYVAAPCLLRWSANSR